MTPDIITIVKELQSEERKVWTAFQTSNPDAQWLQDQYVTKLRDAFPSIAQALLIAVEALEGTMKGLQQNKSIDAQQLIHELQQTLSPIKSL